VLAVIVMINAHSACNASTDAPPQKRASTAKFNVVAAMEELRKEFVESAGEMEPEEMADNLIPVLNHLLPDKESQTRWCQQMLTRLGMVDLAMVPAFQENGPAAAAAAAAAAVRNASQEAAAVSAQNAARPKRAPVIVSPPRTKS
jgi:hypothetical protein